MKTTPNAIVTAAAFGCTPEQARRLFARNAEVLAQMAGHAQTKGGRINGYTAAELRAASLKYATASR